ncbi:hypothetical protein [Alteriqipengyuania lutimaris]|uniref:Uncharacterized protein n=1 Tax=Alteriqipengyuania lutimaris TaxID=1538146 RepID=A0A395LHD6_9SPHN|nr:hypothetical protein [Alteriqipengyuania lutimaris]MBB3034931.1 fatty acid desaturase [Alteriqipengyuania lutimaris]RDS76242.1 hypothetical protein DL238_00495 [Alteriqipengyuania lutimaris]
MDKNEAQSALDAVRNTDRAMADRMRWPFWRHAIFGAMMALVLLAIALPSAARMPVLALVVLLVFLVVRDDKTRHGMFVSGYQKGRTGWVLVLQFALLAASLAATIMLVDSPLTSPLFWAIAAILLIGSTALSLLWEKIYRSDLKAGRA